MTANLFPPAQLVGRHGQTEEMQRAMRTAAKEPQLLLFLGEGGMGKTRLLEAGLEMAGKQPGLLVASEIVDLYDTPTHSRNGLADVIYRALPRGTSFNTYREARRRLNKARVSGEVAAIREQREKTLIAFSEDMQRLAADNRVVIALDTAERLVYGGADGAERLSTVADAWAWLTEVLPTWGDVVVLMGGRPKARQLLEAMQASGTVRVFTNEVNQLEDEEVEQFFEAIQLDALREGRARLAEQVQQLRQPLQQRAGELAEGRPIFLTLFIDLLGASYITADELREDDTPEKWKSRLLERLISLPGVGETVFALGRVPKGADARLLHDLLELKDEPAAEARLGEARRFAFVKSRGQRVFLHDEMYQLLSERYYQRDEDAPDRDRAFKVTLNYYEQAIDALRQEMDALYAPVEFLQQNASMLNLEQVAELTRRRRELQAETVYYSLRHDPVRGYKRFYRFSRDATLSGDAIANRQLESEMLQFWAETDPNIKQAEINGLERRVVEDLVLLQPILSAIAENAFDAAEQAIARLRAQQALQDVIDQHVLDTYEAMILVDRATPEGLKQADAMLLRVTQELSALPQDEDVPSPMESLRAWRVKAALAKAYNVLGFGERTRGQMAQAISHYTLAARLWRDVNLKVELANTQNNMGFAQSQLGYHFVARHLVTEALELRRELGPRSPVGLSMNTLAGIYIREGNFERGFELASQAHALFLVLEDEYGAGLALTTRSEALRRNCMSKLDLTADMKAKDLREARDNAREAYEIFDKLGNKGRMVDALIEEGCACRDWVQVRKSQSSLTDNVPRLVKDSQVVLRKAAELAGEAIVYRKVDALVNLAWLGHVAGEVQLRDAATTESAAAVPNGYRLVPHGGGKTGIQRDQAQALIWPQLGKLHTFMGHWELERSQQLQVTQHERGGAEANLLDAIRNYALGLQYNALYNPNNKDHRDAQRAQEAIYNRLRHIVGRRQHAEIWKAIEQFEKEYDLTDSEIRVFMQMRGL